MGVSWRPISGLPVVLMPQAIDKQMIQASAIVNRLAAKSQFTYYQDNVAASQSSVVLKFGPGAVAEHVILKNAFIIAISLYSNEACTAGFLSVTASVNGTGTPCTTSLFPGDSNTIGYYNETIQFTGAGTSAGNYIQAGQRLGVKLTSSGGWTPITADIAVEVMLVYTGED